MALTQSSDPELRIERLTWPEIEKAIAEGRRRVVICAASSEQHGPHLPEATDAMIGEELSVRLARRLGDALVAPVIRPGCSDHHLGFAGTISISPELLMSLLDAYVASLRRHGFERFAVISSHGGNYPVLARWQPADRSGVTVAADVDGFTGAMLNGLREHGREDRTIPHADGSETAEMLVIAPELVHLDRAATGFVGDLDLETLLSRGMRALTANGVLGEPVGVTAAMGETVLERVVDYLVSGVDG